MRSYKNFKIGDKLYLKKEFKDVKNFNKKICELGLTYPFTNGFADLSKINFVIIDDFVKNQNRAYPYSKYHYGISFNIAYNKDLIKIKSPFTPYSHYYPLDIFEDPIISKIKKLLKI